MKRQYKSIIFGLISSMLFVGVALELVFAEQRASPHKPQSRPAIIDETAKPLLLLMDTDKNGKVSKQEFMTFMEAEFDRLDRDKSGELDAKELDLAQVRVRSFAHVGK